MDYTNKKFTMDDGTVYIVIEQVDYGNHTYLYVANRADEDETKFVEIKDDLLMSINPFLFSEKILPLFIKKFSGY